MKFLIFPAFLLFAVAPLASAQSPPATLPPTAAPTVAVPAAPAIKSLSNARYELNGITFNEDTRAITLPATIKITESLLEYALVHEAGKVHESLLSTPVSPYDLNVVLLLLNYLPAATFFDFSDPDAGAILVKNPKIPTTAQLTVSLNWTDPTGKPHTAPLESLLLNTHLKAPLTPGPFTYTGSFLTEDGLFMAKETGSILALYADAAALLNNPRPGIENDDIWLPDTSKVPAKGTPITVTLTPQK